MRNSVLLVSDSVLVGTVSLCVCDSPFTLSERQFTVNECHCSLSERPCIGICIVSIVVL